MKRQRRRTIKEQVRKPVVYPVVSHRLSLPGCKSHTCDTCKHSCAGRAAIGSCYKDRSKERLIGDYNPCYWEPRAKEG